MSLLVEMFSPELAGTGTQGCTGGEGSGAHAEARAERWRDVAEHVAAARAAAVVADKPGRVGTEPVAANVALRIDTLHGKARQILHAFSPCGRLARIAPGGATQRSLAGQEDEMLALIVVWKASSVKRKHHKMLGYDCEAANPRHGTARRGVGTFDAVPSPKKAISRLRSRR